jgi:hypothetical protein
VGFGVGVGVGFGVGVGVGFGVGVGVGGGVGAVTTIVAELLLLALVFMVPPQPAAL